jgi:hypothetical protein
MAGVTIVGGGLTLHAVASGDDRPQQVPSTSQTALRHDDSSRDRASRAGDDHGLHRHMGCSEDGGTASSGGIELGAGSLGQGSDDHGRHMEPGDDHGRHVELADDHGRHVEPGDDNGGNAPEVADDNRGTAPEVRDDNGGQSGGGDSAGDDSGSGSGHSGSGSDD